MGIVHPKYKVAVVQAAPAWLDLDASIDKSIALIREAAEKGAKLIAFPEAFIPGYPWHIWMDSPAWAIGRGFVQRYFDNSLAYDSPQAEKLRDAVREGDGSDLAVHARSDIGRIGALCCWEHLQPLSKYAMYAQNEQVHVAAWPSFSLYDPFAPALGAEVNNAASRVYAVEGSCFVLAPCATVSQAMIDELCDRPDKNALLHVGGGFAAIYGPDGSQIGDKLAPDQEGLLIAEIDLGAIGVAKNAADPAGHYSRPDVTRLLLNKKRYQRVEQFALPVDTVEPTDIAAAAS